MITFVEFLELCESSTGESGRRRVSSRGPSANRSDRNKQRQDKSNRAALSKAGFSRSPRPVTGKGGRKTKWTETSTSSHHDTETGTYANQSDYATSKIGNLGPKGNKPTSKRALKAKQIRKQLGGDRTPRQVHDVAVNKKRTYDDDNSSTMTKGRSFRKEVTKGVSDNLKKAGAKSGDIVTSTPTSDSRSRMYGKTHNTKTSKRTGVTVNRIREYFSILEVNRPESGSDKEKAAWDKQKARRDALEDPSSVIIGQTGRDREGNRTYTLKSAALRRQQGKNRAARLADIDSDLDPEQKGRGDTKATTIKGRGKEHHHLTSISQSAQEFKGLTPEQRREKREKDTKSGKFHGSDPRNIAQTNKTRGEHGIPHRGSGGYHSSQKAVGKGGSIQDYGSEKEIVAQQRSTDASIRKTGMTHQQRLAKEKGIELPKPKVKLKDTGAAQRMAAAYDKKVGRNFDT
jgi:hypothetical protein